MPQRIDGVVVGRCEAAGTQPNANSWRNVCHIRRSMIRSLASAIEPSSKIDSSMPSSRSSAPREPGRPFPGCGQLHGGQRHAWTLRWRRTSSGNGQGPGWRRSLFRYCGTLAMYAAKEQGRNRFAEFKEGTNSVAAAAAYLTSMRNFVGQLFGPAGQPRLTPPDGR